MSHTGESGEAKSSCKSPKNATGCRSVSLRIGKVLTNCITARASPASFRRASRGFKPSEATRRDFLALMGFQHCRGRACRMPRSRAKCDSVSGGIRPDHSRRFQLYRHPRAVAVRPRAACWSSKRDGRRSRLKATPPPTCWQRNVRHRPGHSALTL